MRRLITREQLENSLQVQVGPYLFVVQFSRGNNVVMEKTLEGGKLGLIEAICMFIEFCRRRGIEYLTIESRSRSDIYYRIARRYFPDDEYFMDGDVLRVRLCQQALDHSTLS